MPFVTQRFALQYPNGREHECAVEVRRELVPGNEITLVGRRWRVSHVRKQRRSQTPELVCTAVDSSPLAKR
jgi:hypothetical protein